MAIDKATGLSDKQKAFCDYYIANGCCGTQAAKDAKYKASSETAYQSIASANLKKPTVQAYIKVRMDSIQSERIATADEAMQIVTSIARGALIDDDNKAPPSMTRLKAAEILLRVNGCFNDKLTVKTAEPIVLAGDNLV